MTSALATGVMPFGSVFSKMVLFTMSQAWQLGRAVKRANSSHTSAITAIVEQQKGFLLISGKVRALVAGYALLDQSGPLILFPVAYIAGKERNSKSYYRLTMLIV